MKKQKIGAIVLAGAMLLSMTGCGNNRAKTYSKYVELGQYKGIEYTKDVAEVTDEDVQRRLDSFVEGLATEDEITDRAVEDGDIANIDFVGKIDGKEFEGGDATGYDLTIGSGSFIDGFEKGLIGHNIDETVSLDLVFPEDYYDTEKAGKEVTFEVTINSISVKNVPELTDALVKDNTDCETIKDYKESIREEIQTSNEQSATQQADNTILEAAIKNAKITGYDEKEVEAHVDDMFDYFQQTVQNYATYGYSYEDVLAMNGYDSEEALKEGITEQVKEYLNTKMVIYCIAREEGLKATSEETDKLVEEYMEAYSVKTKEEVYDYLGDDFFELQVLHDKVMEFLRENAVLVDELTTEETSEDTSAEETTEADAGAEEEEETTEAETEEATTESASEE